MPVILLAIDACSPLEQLLPVALMLASQQHADLRGVFAQDNVLLQGVGLPFTQEIGASSAVCYPVTTLSIEKRVQHIAHKMRQRLAAAADQQHIPWDFQICSGTILQITHETDSDIVLPGWNSNYSAASTRPLCAVSKSMPQTIVVVDDGSTGSKQVIRAARQIVEVTDVAGGSTRNISPGQTRHPQTSSARRLVIFDLPRQEVRSSDDPAVLSEPTATTNLANETHVNVASTEQVIGHLRQLRPSLFLMGRRQRLAEDRPFQRALTMMKCPVALLKMT